MKAGNRMATAQQWHGSCRGSRVRAFSPVPIPDFSSPSLSSLFSFSFLSPSLVFLFTDRPFPSSPPCMVWLPHLPPRVVRLWCQTGTCLLQPSFICGNPPAPQHLSIFIFCFCCLLALLLFHSCFCLVFLFDLSISISACFFLLDHSPFLS